MLKFDTIAGKFEHVPQSNLKENNLLERYDLQTAIVGSWDLFKNEIGFPSAAKRLLPIIQPKTVLTC